MSLSSRLQCEEYLGRGGGTGRHTRVVPRDLRLQINTTLSVLSPIYHQCDSGLRLWDIKESFRNGQRTHRRLSRGWYLSCHFKDEQDLSTSMPRFTPTPLIPNILTKINYLLEIEKNNFERNLPQIYYSIVLKEIIWWQFNF